MLRSSPLESMRSKTLTLAASLIICAVVLVVYYPSIRIGFWGDDWWLVANAGTMNLGQYLQYYFDPSVSPFWYRPLHGILLLAEYAFFGAGPEGYHVVQILIHATCSLLLFAIVWTITRRPRLAFVSALLFAVFFPGGSAVFQVAVHDPLATLFYLAAVLAWSLYLKSRQWALYVAALVSFVLALMGKETSVSLLVTLLLVDWLFVNKPIPFRTAVRRYAPFGLVLLVYLCIEYRVQTHAYFPSRGGYSLGPHMVENLLAYMKLLVWPWKWENAAAFIWAGLAVLLVGRALLRLPRSVSRGVTLFLFLVLEAVLAIAPVLGLPVRVFEPRYLYPASVASAILIAVLFEGATGKAWGWASRCALSLGVAVAVLVLGVSTSDSAAAQAELNRELRVPFRDIIQQHPTYPPDTYIFLIDPPYALKHFGPSMFFFRYGSGVSVASINPEWWGSVLENRPAELRQHRHAFIYYFDEANVRHEIPVEPLAQTTVSPALPVAFSAPITLDGYEMTSTTLKSGKEWAILLYWRATGEIDRDYTVFVHLVDEHGQTVAGDDRQPHDGLAPTHTWSKNRLVTDEHILTIPTGLSPEDRYHVEIGLYYLPTMERLAVLDSAGQVVTDTIVIEPFQIGEEN